MHTNGSGGLGSATQRFDPQSGAEPKEDKGRHLKKERKNDRTHQRSADSASRLVDHHRVIAVRPDRQVPRGAGEACGESANRPEGGEVESDGGSAPRGEAGSPAPANSPLNQLELGKASEFAHR